MVNRSFCSIGNGTPETLLYSIYCSRAAEDRIRLEGIVVKSSVLLL